MSPHAPFLTPSSPPPAPGTAYCALWNLRPLSSEFHPSTASSPSVAPPSSSEGLWLPRPRTLLPWLSAGAASPSRPASSWVRGVDASSLPNPCPQTTPLSPSFLGSLSSLPWRSHPPGMLAGPPARASLSHGVDNALGPGLPPLPQPPPPRSHRLSPVGVDLVSIALPPSCSQVPEAPFRTTPAFCAHSSWSPQSCLR